MGEGGGGEYSLERTEEVFCVSNSSRVPILPVPIPSFVRGPSSRPTSLHGSFGCLLCVFNGLLVTIWIIRSRCSLLSRTLLCFLCRASRVSLMNYSLLDADEVRVIDLTLQLLFIAHTFSDDAL